jgi:hypothetical protein
MNDSQIRELEAGQRAREFAIAQAADFPPHTRGAALSALIEAAIRHVEEQAARQVAANLDRQESTEQKQAALESLLEQLSAINRTARSINQLFPGIADQFKMPRGGDQTVLNLARAYISAATPIASEFTSRGLPETFLTDLQATIDAVTAAENRQAAALAALTSATAGVALGLRQLREALRELDAIMRNRYRQDPATLAAWKSARRVEKAPQRKKETRSAANEVNDDALKLERH